MRLRLGQLGYPVEELDAGHEVLHHPILSDALAFVREPPARQFGQLSAGFRFRVLRHSAFAGHTVLANKLVGWLGFHEATFRSAREWGARHSRAAQPLRPIIGRAPDESTAA